MTVVVGWIACDNHSASAIYGSAYIVSDSRYVINRGTYDNGRKLFALKKSPDIMAYCGDVLFPITTISQINELADSGLLFPSNASSDIRSCKIFEQIKFQFSKYPSHSYLFCDTSIYHIARNEDKMFSVYKYSFKRDVGWVREILPIKKGFSHMLFCDGSGKEDIEEKFSAYNSPKALNTRTSRNIYQCFTQLLLDCSNPTFGGAPQLVGLYRGKNNGMHFGVIHKEQRHYLGSPLQELRDYNFVEWYNDNFERCDGNTMKIKPGAMRQPNPNLL